MTKHLIEAAFENGIKKTVYKMLKLLPRPMEKCGVVGGMTRT